jgi:phage repressor protein C with HTH and peptisase S24 domain
MTYGLASALSECQDPPEVPTNTFRERRKRLRWTQADLAEKARVNVETIVRLETGKNVRMDTVRKVDEALEEGQRDQARHTSTGEHPQSEVESFDRDISRGYKKHDVPVVGDAEASTNGIIAWDNVGLVRAQIEEWVSRAFSDGDPHAYALRVRGDSMVPRYFPGEIVIAQPRIQPKDGDFACVQLVNGERLVKRVFRTPAGWVLRSMNDAYPPRDVSNEEVHAVHVIRHSVARM